MRIYQATELGEALAPPGSTSPGSHHAHALHSPYWWLKCPSACDEDHPLVAALPRFLEWDIIQTAVDPDRRADAVAGARQEPRPLRSGGPATSPAGVDRVAA